MASKARAKLRGLFDASSEGRAVFFAELRDDLVARGSALAWHLPAFQRGHIILRGAGVIGARDGLAAVALADNIASRMALIVVESGTIVLEIGLCLPGFAARQQGRDHRAWVAFAASRVRCCTQSCGN